MNKHRRYYSCVLAVASLASAASLAFIAYFLACVTCVALDGNQASVVDMPGGPEK